MQNFRLQMLTPILIGAVSLASSTVTAQDSSAENRSAEAIRKTAAEYISAVNRGDAEKAVSFWTNDGEYIDGLGRVRNGREILGERLSAETESAQRQPLTLRVRSLRFITKDVAIEDGTSFHAAVGSSEASLAKFAVVWVRKAGKWMIDSVRESPLPSLSNFEKLHRLSSLIGDWVDESGDATVRISARWSEGDNYIKRDFSIVEGDRLVISGTQYIGWDPLARQIRSWTFDSDGGHTVGVWSRDKDAWVVSSQGYMRDGYRTTATNIYTVSDGRMTRRSIDSRVNDQPIPDSEIVLTQVPSEK